MDEKEAREIIKNHSDTNATALPAYPFAMGYLEAIEKAIELVRVIREHMQCICNPQNDITCIRCDTLRKWEKENGR